MENKWLWHRSGSIIQMSPLKFRLEFNCHCHQCEEVRPWGCDEARALEGQGETFINEAVQSRPHTLVVHQTITLQECSRGCQKTHIRDVKLIKVERQLLHRSCLSMKMLFNV